MIVFTSAVVDCTLTQLIILAKYGKHGDLVSLMLLLKVIKYVGMQSSEMQSSVQSSEIRGCARICDDGMLAKEGLFLTAARLLHMPL